MGGSGEEVAWTLSEATCDGPEKKALRSPRYKYVAAFSPPDGERSGLGEELLWEKLFDLTRDPGEQESLHASAPEVAGGVADTAKRSFPE